MRRRAPSSPKNFIRGYTESWNFTLQKDLGRGWIARAGYVGIHTVRQHTRYNINYSQVGGGAPSHPFAKYGITGGLTMILPYEAMHDNSLQTSLQSRFANGFMMQASYTRSKWMGLCCDGSGDGGPAIPIPQYSLLNRSLMGADRPNNFPMTAMYELPFGERQTARQQRGRCPRRRRATVERRPQHLFGNAVHGDV